jgi:hypothetical protein
MHSSLTKLMKLMPPIRNQRHTSVNWEMLEGQVGLTYPKTFKEFVSVYGSSVWFDKLAPLYSVAANPRAIKRFHKSVSTKLERLKGHTYDDDFNNAELPHYPEKGGLFPFMQDSDGPLYLWRTELKNPDEWPIYLWEMGPYFVLEKAAIADVMLHFLGKSPLLKAILGDTGEMEPHRIRIDDVCANE